MSILTEFLQQVAGKENEDIANWLGETFRNAKYCSLCTHIGKFTNPSLNVEAFVPDQPHQNNGYVYTANVFCEKDFKRSASYDSTSKRLQALLLLSLEDGQTVLTHFLLNSDQLIQEFANFQIDFQKLRDMVLQLVERGQSKETDGLVRQVYFPICKDEYHLLSILPPSSLLMKISERLNEMNEKKKVSKKEGSDLYRNNYTEILCLTKIGFGGANPQNISSLCTKYGKKSYVFSSVPPKIEKREITRPRKDFFKETLRRWQFRELFQTLHDRYARMQNNLETRQNTRAAEEHIIDKVLGCAERLRALPKGWTEGKNVVLPKAQKLWLDEKYAAQRDAEPDWKQKIADSMANWILNSYEKFMKNIKANEIVLGDAEFSFLREEILQAL